MEYQQLFDNEERIDQLDHLLFRELGAQQQWRQTFQMWEQRQRQQRRLRLVPFISNLASVAALFIAGLFIQAFVPKLAVNDQLPVLNAQKESASVLDSTNAPVVMDSDTLAVPLVP